MRKTAVAGFVNVPGVQRPRDVYTWVLRTILQPEAQHGQGAAEAAEKSSNGNSGDTAGALQFALLLIGRKWERIDVAAALDCLPTETRISDMGACVSALSVGIMRQGNGRTLHVRAPSSLPRHVLVLMSFWPTALLCTTVHWQGEAYSMRHVSVCGCQCLSVTDGHSSATDGCMTVHDACHVMSHRCNYLAVVCVCLCLSRLSIESVSSVEAMHNCCMDLLACLSPQLRCAGKFIECLQTSAVL